MISVSADRLIDEKTGVPYFQARIALTEDPREKLEGVSLSPGMQAEVMIVTGARTLLDYILAPLTRSFNRAFRES